MSYLLFFISFDALLSNSILKLSAIKTKTGLQTKQTVLIKDVSVKLNRTYFEKYNSFI